MAAVVQRLASVLTPFFGFVYSGISSTEGSTEALSHGPHSPLTVERLSYLLPTSFSRSRSVAMQDSASSRKAVATVGLTNTFNGRTESQPVPHSISPHIDSLRTPSETTKQLDPRTDIIWDHINHIPLSSPDAIRLVTISPGPGQLSCETLQASVNTAHYKALSYEWGIPSPEDPVISIDGQQVRIRRNLYEALCHIRKSQTPKILRYFWIDALCIDQQNVLERNHQVQIMGEIYAAAVNVIAWVGVAGEDGEAAMRSFHRILDGINTHGRDRVAVSIEGQTYSQREEQQLLQRGRTFKVLLSAYELQAMVSFVRRSYWRRMWIIQEIQRARNVTIQCGTLSVKRAGLQSIDNVLRASPARVLESIWSSFAFILIYRRLETLDWWLHFCTNWSCLCKEPRDIIYALLGVASNCRDGGIEVDYAKPILGVYEEAVRLMEEKRRIHHQTTVDFDDRTKRLLARRLGLLEEKPDGRWKPTRGLFDMFA